MTNLELVRAVVVKAVPEIMELKDGCILNLHAGESYGWMTIHRLRSVCKKHKNYREECGDEENGCSIEDAVFGTSGTEEDEGWWQHTVKIEDIKPYQVVGRPITLADVLRAIHKSDPSMTVKTELEGEKGEEGVLALYYRMGDGEIIAVLWNLAAPLDEQEPEVIDFLALVLGC